jgi:hypothetical protein
MARRRNKVIAPYVCCAVITFISAGHAKMRAAALAHHFGITQA